MKNNNLIKVVPILLLLTGCSLFPVNKETRIIIETPPDVLLQEVLVEQPPTIDEYVNLQCTDKEDVLTEKFRTQTKKLDIANSQLRALQEWKTKIVNQYQKKD